MMLSLSHGIAFLCMPKCASTSIEAVLEPHADIIMTGHPGIKHLNFRDYKACVEPLVHRKRPKLRIETFCIMRDPLDWAHSWYRYRARRALKRPDHANHANYTGHIDFDTFLEGMMMDQRPQYARVGTQSGMVLDKEGRVGVDRLFDFRHLDHVSGYLSEKLGSPIRFPRKNRSPRGRLKIDPSNAERFRTVFAREYEIYESLVEDGTLTDLNKAENRPGDV